MSEAQVLDAVRLLHDVSTDDEQRTAVSNYLSSFQRSLLSWNVSMNLLSRGGPVDSQLFAAQTLKEKLRGHSWQLSHDSWQPVRSCIVSVLQRPCEPALEVQVSLCLVAIIILTSSDDVISQLRQALPPFRTLLVLQLLGEEVGSDTSPYEPAPGVDKVDWWLQARRAVGNMAPMVLPFITECISKPNDTALSGGFAGGQPAELEAAARSVLQRGILDAALKTCQDGEKSLVVTACETLTEAFERCPDTLLVNLQPHLLELSALALNPRDSSPVASFLQQSLIALFVAYLQSCADSLVRSGHSDALRALFALSQVAKDTPSEDIPTQNVLEVSGSNAIDGVAAHVIEAIGTIGRALLKAVEDEGNLPRGSSAPGAMASAQLQGMIQVYLEGVIALLPLQQKELEASVGEGHGAPGTEVVHEAYSLAAQLVGPATFAEAISAHYASAGGVPARNPNLAAMLSALVAVLFGSEADTDDMEADGARPRQPDTAGDTVTAGLLELVKQAAAQAQCAETPDVTRRAITVTLFTAARAVAPTLIGATLDSFAATLMHIAACAQHVLRQGVLAARGEGPGPFGDVAISRRGGHRGSTDSAAMRTSSSLVQQSSGAGQEDGISGSASGAIVHVMRALRGTPSEMQLVTETLALLQQVPLPAACDAELLAAVFKASATAAAGSPEGLCKVAGQLTVQVAADMKRAAAAAVGALQTAGLQKGAAGEASMDALSAGGSPEPTPHDAGVSAAFAELANRVGRAAALLEVPSGREGEGRGEVAVAESARPLLPMLLEAVPALTSAMGEEGLVRPACMSQVRQAWGRVIAAAVELDAAASAGLTATVFDVIAEHASVDALVDWQGALAVMIDRYLPRDGGHAPTADRVLLTLQKIWALPELQALPCPGEADMIPEAAIASSVLCSHVARSALTPACWLSMESVAPLVEAGTARCSMAASANLKHVSTAALSALLSMLSASANLPAASMSPLAGCVLRGGGTMMMGFACALTAPGASHRILKLTQLLLQLTVVVSRAVPLVAAPPLVSLPQLPALPFSAGFQGRPSIHPRTLTATSVASGVSYVMLWLKHALACLRPGTLHGHTPDSICSAWQPLLSQAILVGLEKPTGASPGPPAAFSSPTNPPMEAGAPAALPSASPFLGLPAAAAAAPLSAHPNVVTWGSLGAGTRFGSALRTDIPFAAQLSPHMSSAAVFADQQAAAPFAEAFSMSDTLASAPCRALKKAIRAVVASLAAPPPPAAPLSDSLSSFPFTPFSSGPLAPATASASQQVFQPALCLTGNAFTAQPAFPAMPMSAGSPVLLPHVLAPAPVHVPLNSHVMHPMTIANGAAPPLSTPPVPFFAASAAPAAFYSPSFSAPSALPVMPNAAVPEVAPAHVGIVPAAMSHAPGIAQMQVQALGLSPQATGAAGSGGMHSLPLGMHALQPGSGTVLPGVGSLEHHMEAVMIGQPNVPAPAAMVAGVALQRPKEQERPG